MLQKNIKRVRVLLNEHVKPLDYILPKHFSKDFTIGTPIFVPLRNTRTRGYIIDIINTPWNLNIPLKEVLEIDISSAILPKKMIELILFAADYYWVSKNRMLKIALPKAQRKSTLYYSLSKQGKEVLQDKLLEDDRLVLEFAFQYKKPFTLIAIEKKFSWTHQKSYRRIQRLKQKMWLIPQKKKDRPRQLIAYKRTSKNIHNTDELFDKKQKKLKELFDQIPKDTFICANLLSKTIPSVYQKLKKLENMEVIERVKHEKRYTDTKNIYSLKKDIPTPTQLQSNIIEEIKKILDKKKYTTFLLEGVTGSGKTEIYLRLIEYIINQKGNVLVLVPEISLTPQLATHFYHRFGERVATFHSGLTQAERRDEWERIAKGEVQIGLGARSAVFLPFKTLDIIIIDEEHETSYKQNELPCYNARDLAVFRGKSENAIVLLGSATPSLESKHRTETKHYHSIILSKRVTPHPLPHIECIDLLNADRVENGIFTKKLIENVEDTLNRDEQVILFLNRRGFSPYVFCTECGYSFRCEECDVTLTLHRKKDFLMCHYCGFKLWTPELCPDCKGFHIEAQGLGTERLENELKTLLEGIKITRIDKDTVRNKDHLYKKLNEFYTGQKQILIGTQIIAKGHHFPNVSFVGVVSADMSLNFPDFRASERTFQLLTQVAGRAGRGKYIGNVLIQAYNYNHFALKKACDHDYTGFVQEELKMRKELFYPPFSHLVLLRFESKNKVFAKSEADSAYNQMKKMLCEQENICLYHPVEAPLSYLRGYFRFQILIKSEKRSSYHKLLVSMKTPSEYVRRIIDIDPINML